MLGLIIKDFLYIKNLWKNILIMFICAIIVSFTMNYYLLAISIIPLMLVTTGINTFQADEFYNSDIYTITYPLKRSEIVKSKYLFTIISFIIALILSFILYIIFGLIIGFDVISIDILLNSTLLLVVVLIIDFIFYPIIYKFGCEKSSFVFISIIVAIQALFSILVVILNKINIAINYKAIIEFTLEHCNIILSIFLLVTFLISYTLSVHIYKKLDF